MAAAIARRDMPLNSTGCSMSAPTALISAAAARLVRSTSSTGFCLVDVVVVACRPRRVGARGTVTLSPVDRSVAVQDTVAPQASAKRPSVAMANVAVAAEQLRDSRGESRRWPLQCPDGACRRPRRAGPATTRPRCSRRPQHAPHARPGRGTPAPPHGSSCSTSSAAIATASSMSRCRAFRPSFGDDMSTRRAHSTR